MCCYRRSHVVDVEITDRDVSMVVVVMVDVVVVVDDEAAQSRRRKKNALRRSCRRGRYTLQMSEGVIGDESTGFAKTGGSPSSTRRFCHNRVAV